MKCRLIYVGSGAAARLNLQGEHSRQGVLRNDSRGNLCHSLTFRSLFRLLGDRLLLLRVLRVEVEESISPNQRI